MDPVDYLGAHDGVAHRRTLLAAGVSKSALTRALADGRILRAHHRVYCLGTSGGVGLVSHVDLLDAARHARGRGAGRLRRVVACSDPRSGSVPESARMLLTEHGIRPPYSQYALRAMSGRHLATVDFAWPDLRVVVEADGFEYHRDRKAYLRDRNLGNACTVAGWRLLRFSWEDIFRRPVYVVRSTQNVLEAAMSEGASAR